MPPLQKDWTPQEVDAWESLRWKQISWKLAEVTWKSAVWNLKWMVFEEVLNGYSSSCFESHTTQIAGWSSDTFTASLSY